MCNYYIAMLLLDLANDIYMEIGEPVSPSISAIATWLENNYGNLDTLIHEYITFDLVATEFSPELSIEQANIFKLLYLIKYTTGLMSANLGASAYDWSRVTEGDTTVQRVSRNEIAKTYAQMRSAYQAQLDNLVFLYKKNQITPAAWGDVRECDIFDRWGWRDDGA